MKKLNKTLALIQELNNEGEALTVYGRKNLDKILSFKAVKSFDWDSDLGGGFINLEDGTSMYVNYSDITG